jgi:Fuc2NAc and GlcNAc transferase
MREGFVTALTAAAIAVALSPLWRRAALRWGWMDRPNERSLHVYPVARGGGVAILAAVCVAYALNAGLILPRGAFAVVLSTALLAVVGLWDDRASLSPFARLGFQAAAGVAVLATYGGLTHLPLPEPLGYALGPLGTLLAFVWIVAVVNFYNFLDGIDGLAASQGVLTGAAIALCSWDAFAATTGAALAGACAGFLIFNWPPARLFMGDVGSGTLGFVFAVAPLLAPTPAERSAGILVVALSLWLFLADATWTLLRRARRGARWYEAHREHLYQQLVLSGWSHGRVTTLLVAAAVVPTVLGVSYWRTGWAVLGWWGLAAAISAFAAELVLARRRSFA